MFDELLNAVNKDMDKRYSVVSYVGNVLSSSFSYSGKDEAIKEAKILSEKLNDELARVEVCEYEEGKILPGNIKVVWVSECEDSDLDKKSKKKKQGDNKVKKLKEQEVDDKKIEDDICRAVKELYKMKLGDMLSVDSGGAEEFYVALKKELSSFSLEAFELDEDKWNEFYGECVTDLEIKVMKSIEV